MSWPMRSPPCDHAIEQRPAFRGNGVTVLLEKNLAEAAH